MKGKGAKGRSGDGLFLLGTNQKSTSSPQSTTSISSVSQKPLERKKMGFVIGSDLMRHFVGRDGKNINYITSASNGGSLKLMNSKKNKSGKDDFVGIMGTVHQIDDALRACQNVLEVRTLTLPFFHPLPPSPLQNKKPAENLSNQR